MFGKSATGIGCSYEFTHVSLVGEVVFNWVAIVIHQRGDSENFFHGGNPIVVGLKGTITFPLSCKSQVCLGHIFFMVMRRVYDS